MIENTQSLAGSGLGLLVTAATVLGLSWIIVLARSYARLQLHAFMSDDWLMTIGLVPFTITCVSAIMCAYNGVGSDFHDLDDDSYRAGCMWFVLLQLFYALATAPIKSSICAFLLRFTAHRKIERRAIYVTIVIAAISAFIAAIGACTQARPLSRIWERDHKHGVVPLRIHWFSFFIAAMSIIVDGTLAILPMMILWSIHQPPNIKIGLVTILGLGSLSCVATIAGLAFLVVHRNDEGLIGRAALGICMVLELGIGVIAGSIGALKPLFLKWSSRGRSRPQEDIELESF